MGRDCSLKFLPASWMRPSQRRSGQIIASKSLMDDGYFNG